ncbi:MAG: hypothetical protein JSW08_03070 [archaeon]|nr:MAG: hypothetical protein JSW08_03070 [archaeon]
MITKEDVKKFEGKDVLIWIIGEGRPRKGVIQSVSRSGSVYFYNKFGRQSIISIETIRSIEELGGVK